MLYLVRMEVALPASMSESDTETLKSRERDYSHRFQASGAWVELWRVVGEYANYSVFDVAGHDELHDILSGLPLFPYMTITVTPLATHPSRLVP